MRKLLHVSLFILPFAISGCSFTVNAAMCDQIRTDPNAVIPKECRNYDEKEAEKASVINHEINGSDIIKFSPKEK